MSKIWIFRFMSYATLCTMIYAASKVGVVVCIKNSTPPAEITVCSLNFTWE